jgi:hypothetical protein
MRDDVTVEIDVSNENIAREIGYGILGRAMDIHENPDDDFEHVAIELKEIAWDVLNEYDQ